MAFLEIVAPNMRADVQILDSPSGLLAGIADIVKPAFKDTFDDMQWMLYMGSMEFLIVETSTFMKALLEKVGKEPKDSPRNKTPGLNVLPLRGGSVRHMSEIDGVGGGFSRISSMRDYRYVLAPSSNNPDKSIDVDLSHAITFDGGTMALAMASIGIDAEIIDYREEPDFPAYRQRTIGQFFLNRVYQD